MRFNCTFLTMLLALVCCQVALPQKYEISPVFAFNKMSSEPLGSLNSTALDNDTKFKSSATGYGVRLTRNTKGYYGHELGYILNRAKVQSLVRTDVDSTTVETQREGTAKVHEAFYNFMMYMMPSGEFWRPYITVGAQYFQYKRPSDIPEWNTTSTRNFGFNYGGGIKFNVAKHVLLRADFRHYMGGKPYDLRFEETSSSLGVPSSNSGGLIGQLEGSVGFGITF